MLNKTVYRIEHQVPVGKGEWYPSEWNKETRSYQVYHETYTEALDRMLDLTQKDAALNMIKRYRIVARVTTEFVVE